LAHLWIEDAKGTWAVFPLLEAGYRLSTLPPVSIDPAADSSRGVCLLPALAHGKATWVLVAPVGANVRVNGWALKTGLHVMADRDEVEVAGAGTFFFSI